MYITNVTVGEHSADLDRYVNIITNNKIMAVLADSLNSITYKMNTNAGRRSNKHNEGKVTFDIDGDIVEWSDKDKTSIVALGEEYQRQVMKGNSNLFLPVIAYYSINRNWDYNINYNNILTNDRINGYTNCLSDTPDIGLMKGWLVKMLVYKYQNQELGINSLPVLEAVYKAMNNCFAKLYNVGEVDIQYKLSLNNFNVHCNDGIFKDATDITLDKLSKESIDIISIVAGIAYRMAALNPQLYYNVCNVDGIVLINSLWLYLESYTYDYIINILRGLFPNVQFIIS